MFRIDYKLNGKINLSIVRYYNIKIIPSNIDYI
jgi:hypothetical protein